MSFGFFPELDFSLDNLEEDRNVLKHVHEEPGPDCQEPMEEAERKLIMRLKRRVDRPGVKLDNTRLRLN